MFLRARTVQTSIGQISSFERSPATRWVTAVDGLRTAIRSETVCQHLFCLKSSKGSPERRRFAKFCNGERLTARTGAIHEGLDAAQFFLRLVQKWLAAGVLEDGTWARSEVGSPQGATVSPLLANVYLHHVLDLWVQRWRFKEARGGEAVLRPSRRGAPHTASVFRPRTERDCSGRARCSVRWFSRRVEGGSFSRVCRAHARARGRAVAPAEVASGVARNRLRSDRNDDLERLLARPRAERTRWFLARSAGVDDPWTAKISRRCSARPTASPSASCRGAPSGPVGSGLSRGDERAPRLRGCPLGGSARRGGATVDVSLPCVAPREGRMTPCGAGGRSAPARACTQRLPDVSSGSDRACTALRQPRRCTPPASA